MVVPPKTNSQTNNVGSKVTNKGDVDEGKDGESKKCCKHYSQHLPSSYAHLVKTGRLILFCFLNT